MFDYEDAYFTKRSFSELIEKFEINDSPDLNKIELSRFFDILNRLKMENGWTPCYKYIKQNIGAEPIVYAVNKSGVTDKLYNRVITDGTIEGFIQLAYLYLLHDKFCLFWHAIYKEIHIIISIRDLFNLPFQETELFDIAPNIKIDVERKSLSTSISICVFNKWSGLTKFKFNFSNNYPHNPNIIDDETKIIKEYDCSILF